MKLPKQTKKMPKLKPAHLEDCSHQQVGILDDFHLLTGPLALHSAFRRAVIANLVDPWKESFEDLSSKDKLKVLAHCVCRAYGGGGETLGSATAPEGLKWR